MQKYKKLRSFYGDIHNHCAVGYGHGSLEDAFHNARLQLDFAAVTVHAHWPDIPDAEARLTALAEYHRRGFRRSAEAWPFVKDTVAANNVPGKFITFLAFEWHSNQFGDYNVYFNGSEGEIIRASNLEEMCQELRKWNASGIQTMLIPHHIGYRRGYRGINWDSFTPEFSPVVEIMSMHGNSESPNAPYPYLHTMGPRDWHSMYQYGLAQGNVVGVMGSTDHHSGHPGSYGNGRMTVWSKELTRQSIWDAIQARRTVALTGDRIALAFSINDGLIGDVVPSADERVVTCSVRGGGAIDYVEVLHNNRVIYRVNNYEKLLEDSSDPFSGPVKVYLELGWCEKGKNVDWQVDLQVLDGDLVDIEPRFRGHDVVAPQSGEEKSYAFSDWQPSGNGIRFTTRTWGNTTTTTTGTQGVALEIVGGTSTRLRGQINGQQVDVALGDLLEGPVTGYLGAFLTPAYCFHRAIPEREFTASFEFPHQAATDSRDWYTVRVRQYNDQWAWSSPIWVESPE